MTQEEFFKRYTYSVRNDKIGGGGFGTVYKAYDNTLHREVAIKVSEVKTAANGKVFSLKDEFEALRGLPPHPNIANYEEFYSFESPQGVFDYAVMQYYPDGNLSNLIKAGLDPAQKENVALQLLDGVSFLHQHNVVHRDLKPGNILVVKHDGKIIPLITDFGLSKAADTTDRSMFSNSFGGGTARYSSPEQLQGQPLRLNTDLWSYGVIVYELFTGNPLFEAGSSASNSAQADLEIYNKIINGDTGGRLGSVPEKWRKVLERCLVVDPEKRVKSAEELLQIIRKNTNGHAKVGPKDSENTDVIIDGDGTDDDTAFEKEKNPSRKASKNSDLENRKMSAQYEPQPTHRKLLPWIIGGIVAVGVIAAIVIGSLQNPDTKTYQSCQTVDDYRAYISKYGSTAKHFEEAKQFVDKFVADSIALQEEEAYKGCSTIEDCEAYLENYPEGRYFKEISNKKAELEKQKQRAIGDLVVFDDGTKGVVFYVDKTGEHGLVVSMDEGYGPFWKNPNGVNVPKELRDTYESYSSINVGKGMKLTTKIINAYGDDVIPATWARSHGKDWYLPSNGEMFYMLRVANKRSGTQGPVSVGLSRNGGITLSAKRHRGYFTSSLSEVNNGWIFSFDWDATYMDCGPGSKLAYRAVRKF